MSTLKMTFSLASLILILGLVFATAPAMAQIDQILYIGNSGDTNAPDASTDGIDNAAAVTIPANGHLIIHKGARTTDAAMNTEGLPVALPTGAVAIQWENMPDLEELFFGNAGGTIALKATQTYMRGDPLAIFPSGGTDFRIDPDGEENPIDLTDNRDIAENDAAITEVMWALDNSQAGTDAVDNRQWIEIHNRLGHPLPTTGFILHIKSGRPGSDQISKDDVEAVVGDAGTADDLTDDTLDTQGRTVLDWFSNVDVNGWQNTPPGQNGFHAVAPNLDSRVDFISMKRNRGKLGKTEGTTLGNWSASTNVYLPGYKGTPGAAERTGPISFTASPVSLDIVFNEVANHSNPDYEWFELYNPDGELPNFENWTIRIVTGNQDADQKLFLAFSKLDPARYGNLLLVTKTDPANNPDHPLALGYNVKKGDADQLPGHDPNIRYYVADTDWKLDMPNKETDGSDVEFVLVLRNHKDKVNHDNVVDIAGYHSNLTRSNANFESSQWPLRGHGAPASAKNLFTEGTVQKRNHVSILGTGTTHGDKKDDQVAFRDVGWTGIGYKRNADATAANGGTPGYPNGALKSNHNADGAAAVIISEIMYAPGERTLTQWIELQNTSKDIGVSVNNWYITIVNHDQVDADGGTYDGALSANYKLTGHIPPGQTYLIAARSSRNDTNLPSERIEIIGKKRTETILNTYGFEITLEAFEKANRGGARVVADVAGNLSPAPAVDRRGNAQSFLPTLWTIPDAINDEGDRSSIVRVSGTDGPLDGTTKAAWVLYSMSGQFDLILDPTSYGHSTDMSSPGHRAGGVLPVSLSKFRPERMKDTGEIVIRWVTESELNNAGFNILRSETRNGEFTKINKELIAGQGTTSERTAYEYPDTSAKPNVVYYYQIQDVSLDGQVTTLRTTHLRGNVTAAGKLTTTWGELKALQ